MLNQMTMIGNLGADPEIRTMGSGDRCANLRVALTEKWKVNGERKERTEWVTVVIWSEGLVKVAQDHLRKGSKVYIQGKLRTRKWKDQSGNDRYSTEVVLQGFDAKLVMLDGKRDGDDGGRRGGYGSDRADRYETEQGYGGGGGGDFQSSLDDEIPF